MSKLEVFQNGVFSSTREPIFQIGSKQADGTYAIEIFDLMSKEEAEHRCAALNKAIAGYQPPVAKKKEAPKKVVAVPLREELKAMTKVELEKVMRKYGLELDRRETKDALIKQSVAFLKRK
tara:strand:+ start:484 stop:846 length:363 start_codon:yes stop_codon:yes gene_type:complete